MSDPWQSDRAAAQAILVTRSYRHWIGRDLLPGLTGADVLARELFTAPFVLAGHGTEIDPILNYGNQAALTLWEMSWDQFTGTPSRLTAEPVAREERARLLGEVTRNGYIANYSGIRISRSGRRFRIVQATVWNLRDDAGRPAGQAAMFDRWEFL